jgi:hypothetical protein
MAELLCNIGNATERFTSPVIAIAIIPLNPVFNHGDMVKYL